MDWHSLLNSANLDLVQQCASESQSLLGQFPAMFGIVAGGALAALGATHLLDRRNEVGMENEENKEI